MSVVTNPLVKIDVVIGENTRQILSETTLILPVPAIKIRDIVVRVRDLDTQVIENKVIVQGVLHKQIFFVGTDNVVRHIAEDVPFSTFLDIPGALPGMDVQVHPTIEAVIPILLNPTTLLQKIVLEIFIKVTEKRQINIALGDGPLVRVNEVVGEGTVQTLEETVVTLDCPAIKVDAIDATVKDITFELIDDKVIIQGIIHKQIFYICEDNIEHHQAEDVPFSVFVDIPGATAGMDVQVHPTVEFVAFTLETPTTLRQKVVLEIFVKVTERVQLQVALGTGPLVKVEAVRGENTQQFLSETIVTLPVPAIKVREIDAKVENITTEILEDKVIIQGTIHKQIYFIDTNNVEREFTELVPFSTFIDVPGAEEGFNVEVVARIEFVGFNLLNEVELEQKVVVELFVKVTETVQILVEEVQVGPYVPPYIPSNNSVTP